MLGAWLTAMTQIMMEVEKVGSCVFIHMKCGKNVMTPDFLRDLNEALDKAESYKDAKAVITTGNGKYYCTGVDMGVVNSPEFVTVIGDLQKLLARLVTFPLVTVAAVNGHSFGGGAVLALAHDYKIMYSGRGWFCIPLARFKRNFPVGLLEFIRATIPAPEHHSTVAFAKRYTAPEAQAAGIINEVSSLEELKENAIAAANKLAGDGLDRKTLSAIKHDLHKDVYQALMEPVRFYSQL